MTRSEIRSEIRSETREHIGFVLPSLEIGGMEKFVVLLGGALRARGFAVSVVCTRAGGPLVAEAEVHGITVRVSPFQSRWDNVRPTALVHTMRDLGITLVHSQSGNWMAAAIAGRMLGVPVCHTEHGMMSRPERTVYAVQKRIALGLTDLTAVVSHQLVLDLAAQLHVSPSRFETVPNGIPTARHTRDVALRTATRAMLGVAPDTVLVGCVARLHHLKGVDLLAQAAAQIPADAPLAIVVVGDGDDRTLIEPLVAQSRVPMRLLGARSDVPALLQAFDVLALPSRSEALPLALLEGMAAGCTIVASAVGEMPTIVGTDAGVLVPPGDVSALATALETLASDPVRRARLAHVALDRVRADFDVDAMVDRYCAMYERARHR